jgi:vancomycin resistance protein YoaR
MTKAVRNALIALSIFLAIALIWFALWIAAGSKIPPRTTLLGVDISRLTEEGAVAKVRAEAGPLINSDLTLLIDQREYKLPIKKSGLSLDLNRSINQISPRTWNPTELIPLIFSAKKIEPVVMANEEQFKSGFRSIEERVNVTPRNADISYEGLRPQLIRARAGKVIDRQAALSTISRSWLRSDVINLPLVSKEAEITDEEAEKVLSFAERATSEPVEVILNVADPVKILVSPRVISQALTFVPASTGELQPKWLKATFINLVGKQWSANLVEPVNASFNMVDGAPRVQPSKDGLDVPENKLGVAIIEALDKGGDARQATVIPEPVAAKITTEMAGGLGIKEIIGSFTTNFPFAEYRLINIHRAARWMDGVILQPGEIFSYNAVVGERTEARGFVPGIIIDKGIFKKDLGGGVSQVATTTWNAAWFSGLELIQHKPHSFYISRYPPGRESTVAWPNVDVKFGNNSGYPIFVDTSYTSKSVTVTIYGTKFVDIETETGPRTNQIPFKILENDSKECIFQEGVPGFTIDVWRILKRDGVEFKREKYRTRYRAEDRIICTNPEARWMNPPLSVQKSFAD